jgi:hypothetical protein
VVIPCESDGRFETRVEQYETVGVFTLAQEKENLGLTCALIQRHVARQHSRNLHRQERALTAAAADGQPAFQHRV